ncbi:hypothetical protein Tco_1489399, partial [Tanacetum coccineum]
TKYRDRSRGRDHSRSIKRWRKSESLPSRGSESNTSDRGHSKSRAKKGKPADEEDLVVPWTCEHVDPFTPRIRNFKSSQKTRMPNNVKTYDGTGDPKDHLKIFQAAAQFDELPPESIDGYKGLKAAFLAYFMQQKKYVKDPHVPKTVEEMMIATTAFIRGDTAAASKKKVHTPWKSLDQSKRHTSERRSDFQNQPKDGRGSNKFTPLTRTPK